MTTQRKYEIVLYGASGYTGVLIADYFATTVDVTESYISGSSTEVNEEEEKEEGKPKIRLALAGRNASKLENVKAEMVKLNPSCKNVDILIADISDQKSIDDFVKETKVVLSTVGPFRQFGTPVVDACVRHNTDYCDITGETLWVRSLIDKYHEEAKLKGLKIVPFCGYDSIPSDLGTYMLVDYAKNKLNRTLSHVTSYIGPIEGSISGGTAATMIDVMSNVRGAKLGHPFLLSPDEKSRNAPKDQKFLGYSSEVKKWTAPFFMGVVNSRVVRRSASLDPSLYGSKFRYSECVQFKNFFTAFLYSMFMLAAVVGLSIPPLRTLVKKYLPKQGEGPTKKQRESGYFSHTVVGNTVPLGVEDKSIRVEGIVKAKGDPGYEVTRKLVAESALCLALQRNKLPQHYGVVTPALAMGNFLVNRLRRIGVTFEVTKPK